MQHWKRACSKGVKYTQEERKVLYKSIHHRWQEDGVFRVRMHGEAIDEQEILEWDRMALAQKQQPIKEMSYAERRATYENQRVIVSTHKGGEAGTKPVTLHPQFEEFRGKAKAAKKE